ncbi:hypothetical protein Hanom_Chr14g01284561 [Helianthus anomalus]
MDERASYGLKICGKKILSSKLCTKHQNETVVDYLEIRVRSSTHLFKFDDLDLKLCD